MLTSTPDIYFDGAVTNETACSRSPTISAASSHRSRMNAATIQIVVPKGTFTFLGGIGSFYDSDSAVTSQWATTENRPDTTR